MEDTYGMKVNNEEKVEEINTVKEEFKEESKEKRGDFKDKAKKRLSLFAARPLSEDNDSGGFRAAVARAFRDNYHGEKTPGTPESGRRLVYNPNQSSFDGDISK